MADPDVGNELDEEASIRARLPFLRRRPLLPTPEVTFLIDTTGRVVKTSAQFAGKRLSQLTYAEGLTIHETFHPECDDADCELARSWERAWASHQSGLPVEWLWLSPKSNVSLKMRLQPVSYACGMLFGDAVCSYEDHSVLFVQDLSSLEDSEVEVASAEKIRVENATLYMQRRATDFDPDLVATLDKRLRAVTGRLLHAQEQERKRIAAELHDGLGQSLSLLRFELEALLEWAQDHLDAGWTNAIERICAQARRGLEELRSVTSGLHEQAVGEAGLLTSLDVLCADFRSTRSDIELHFDFGGFTYDVPVEIGVAIYRITQEALNNISRHSSARAATIELSSNKTGVHLGIRDDGVGFEGTIGSRRGLGLVTMRDRTERLGGSFDIESSKGQGCNITASWPFKVVTSLGNQAIFDSIGRNS